MITGTARRRTGRFSADTSCMAKVRVGKKLPCCRVSAHPFVRAFAFAPCRAFLLPASLCPCVPVSLRPHTASVVHVCCFSRGQGAWPLFPASCPTCPARTCRPLPQGYAAFRRPQPCRRDGAGRLWGAPPFLDAEGGTRGLQRRGRDRPGWQPIVHQVPAPGTMAESGEATRRADEWDAPSSSNSQPRSNAK